MVPKDSFKHSNPESGERNQPVAVIDIGSNSVRLVVYSGVTRTPIPLHNEKIICALGKGLEKTGRLNAAGVAMAVETVARFVNLAKAMGVVNIDTLATAAVRDAVDGHEFANTIEKFCDIKVQVLTGEQEAKRSAMGVLCGIPDAEGITADLGGGSLELVRVGDGAVSEATTLPLGLLRLEEASNGDRSVAVSIISKALNKHTWVAQGGGKTLYAVGGAWRNLARVCIAQMKYPIHVLDNFTLEREQAISLFSDISRLDTISLKKIKGVSKTRLENLSLAIVVLEHLLEVNKPSDIVFSIYGMREGQFFSGLPEVTRKQDPLISLVEEMSHNAGRNPAIGRETFEWMSSLFKEESPSQLRLRLAACLLRDVWWKEHPDYRAEQAFLRVLRLPFLGLAHKDRAGLALALHYRYGANISEPSVVHAHSLLDKARIHRVKTIGLAMRLGYALSAGGPDMLCRTSLSINGDSLVLELPDADPLFKTGSYARHLVRLAEHLELKPLFSRV